MGLIKEIKENFALNDFPKEPNYKMTILGDIGGYFENILCVKYYTENEIALCYKRGGITIRGNNLYIKKYCQGDVVICGKIIATEIT